MSSENVDEGESDATTMSSASGTGGYTGKLLTGYDCDSGLPYSTRNSRPRSASSMPLEAPSHRSSSVPGKTIVYGTFK